MYSSSEMRWPNIESMRSIGEWEVGDPSEVGWIATGVESSAGAL